MCDVVMDGEIKFLGWHNRSWSNQNDFPVVDGILVQVFSPRSSIAVNTEIDAFTFKLESPTRNDQTPARAQEMALVNVYPNPYKGFNIEERGPLSRFVTFTHLPETNATIRIFTLMGELVMKIQHTNGTQYERWDLRNFIGVPVASGMYLVRVDMEGLGVKVLKLAVLQPTEILDFY